jgi:hypothetical protein
MGDAGGLGTTDGVGPVGLGTGDAGGLGKTDSVELGTGGGTKLGSDALGLAEGVGQGGLGAGVARPAPIVFSGQVGETALAK